MTELMRMANLKERKPIEAAKMFYGLYSDVPFEQDLAEYLTDHCVISRPTLFAMFCLSSDKDGQPAWFVRFACGNLLELLMAMPVYLPKLLFCRNGFGKPKSDKVREYSTDRMARLALAHTRKEK
jgi:hypothetical protein